MNTISVKLESISDPLISGLDILDEVKKEVRKKISEDELSDSMIAMFVYGRLTAPK